MKKILPIFLLLSSLCSIAHAAVYAQFINSQTQFVGPSNINKPTIIAIQPVKGSISGIDWDKNNQALTIKEDGVYTVISTLQYGIQESSTINLNKANFYYWLDVNGKPLPHTGHSTLIDPLTKLNVIEYSSVLPLKAGMQLRFMFSSTTADLGLINLPSTTLQPAAPGFSVSIFKVGNIVDYL